MLQVAICDDCREDVEHLTAILHNIMEKHSVAYKLQVFSSGEELLEAPLDFSIIFLDIIMDGKEGTEIGRLLYRKNCSAKIIFQTSYNEFWREAINRSHAFAFLEKPLKEEAVEEQLGEFLNKDTVQAFQVDFKDVIRVQDGKEQALLRLPLHEILYFEYVKKQKKIKIVTEEQEYLVAGFFREVEERMDKLGFEICCRGILVNLERVRRIKGYSVVLDNGALVPLSQRRVAQFKERINEYIFYSI